MVYKFNNFLTCDQAVFFFSSVKSGGKRTFFPLSSHSEKKNAWSQINNFCEDILQ